MLVVVDSSAEVWRSERCIGNASTVESTKTHDDRMLEGMLVTRNGRLAAAVVVEVPT